MKPVVVCASIIGRDNHVLLVRESKPSALGRWSLPGGKLETGESLEAGAAREAFEETGLTVSIGGLIGIYHCAATLEGGAAVIFVYQSTIIAGRPQTSVEHPQVEFVSPQRFDELLSVGLIRGQHVPLALNAWRQGADLGRLTVTTVVASPPPGPHASPRN